MLLGLRYAVCWGHARQVMGEGAMSSYEAFHATSCRPLSSRIPTPMFDSSSVQSSSTFRIDPYTTVAFQAPEGPPLPRDPGPGTGPLIESPERWAAAISVRFAGYPELVLQIVQHLYGFHTAGTHGMNQLACCGLLLHGIPGTGKTLLASSLASSSGLPVFSISGPELYGGKTGQSEEQLVQLFQQAQAQAPSFVVLEELDVVAPSQGTVNGRVEQRVATLLSHIMDGPGPRGHHGVMVIGTTNQLHMVDPSLCQHPRFGRVLELPCPNTEQRLAILSSSLGRHVAPALLASVAEKCHGFVAADLHGLCTEVVLEAIQRQAREETGGAPGSPIQAREEDFARALAHAAPSAISAAVVHRPDTRFEDVAGLDEAIRHIKAGQCPLLVVHA